MTVGYAGVRVLVLGATGFVGRWVARRLTQEGAAVICGVRNVDAMQAIGHAYGFATTIVPVDLLRPESVAMLIDSYRPAVTFNLAGYGVDRSEQDVATFWRINAELVGQLGDLVQRYVPSEHWPGQRLVHTGSALEYGPIGGPLPEDAAAAPTTLYGITKLAGTLSLGVSSAVTARLFTVYGPGEHDGRLLPSLLHAQRTGQCVPLSDGRQQRDFTYIEDVAEGLLRLGRQPATPGGVVNLATGRLCSVREFAETTATVLGIPTSRLAFGSLPWRADEMPHGAVDVKKLRQTLGWVPSTSVADGVARTASFSRP